VVDANSMTIYKGNGTFEAAKIAGFKKVPVVLREFKSKAAAEAYGISDNKASEWSDWDEDMLQKIMEAEEFQPLKKSTGFEEKDLMGRKAGDVDWRKEWEGMPEFNQKDMSSKRQLIVHFRNEKDVQEFAELIEQKILNKTKYLWYPIKKRDVLIDKEYRNES